MAENFNLIFGSQAPTTASWSDADYQTGWNVVGSTPPTAEQFDALQNRSDKKAQDLNNRMLPLEQKAEEQGRQAGTAYTVGAAVTVDGLPADWLLVCTTAGTSGTVAITLPDPLLDGATINDGTITWTLRKIATNGSIGYRQPNTAYKAGKIAYHSALPTGWYLECTTAGTSGSGDLSISSPSIGGTATDGTVVWTIRQGASTNNLTSFTSGILTTNSTGISRTSNSSQANLYGGTPGSSGRLKLVGGEDTNLPGGFDLSANNGTDSYTLEGRIDGTLLWGANDLAGSAIVAKSLSTNGYIKYASGLIIQWGSVDMTQQATTKTVNLPVSFPRKGITGCAGSIDVNHVSPCGVTVSQSSITIKTTAASSWTNWFAIGY